MCSISRSVSRVVAVTIACAPSAMLTRSEEHTSELQSQSNLVCRLLLEKKKKSPIFSQSGINMTAVFYTDPDKVVRTVWQVPVNCYGRHVGVMLVMSILDAVVGVQIVTC